MKIFGIAGYSGSGKTTLIEKLIPVCTQRGLAVSLIKHAHHTFDIDQPGKDSYRHRHAGFRAGPLDLCPRGRSRCLVGPWQEAGIVFHARRRSR